MTTYLVNDSFVPNVAQVVAAMNAVMERCEGEREAWHPAPPVRYEHAGNGLSGHIYINTYHNMSQKEPTNTWCVHYNTGEYGLPKVVF